jgi:hypothetical protein
MLAQEESLTLDPAAGWALAGLARHWRQTIVFAGAMSADVSRLLRKQCANTRGGLLLRGEGLDSCPQEALSLHAKLIKDFVGISDETHIFFCGIAIGYRETEDPVNTFEREREPIDGNVRFMGF